jgi:tripartite ATP-independent transporter DctM subunit
MQMEMFVLFGSFVILLMIGMPISFVLGISSLICMIVCGTNLLVIPTVYYAQLTNFVLLAVPLFILAANMMTITSMSSRIISISRIVVGNIKGGLALVNIIASMIFAGISGAALADASSIGTVLYKSMIDEGYEPDYSAALSAASSSVGPIIPPSIPMVVAGVMANVSIAKLFIGGILPGLLIGLGQGIVAYIIAIKRNHPHSELPTVKKAFITFYKGIVDIFMPLIVIGGIIFGMFTPTEASAIAVIYVLVIGLFRREFTWVKALEAIKAAIGVTSQVLFITINAMIFGRVLTYARVPKMLIDFVLQNDLSTLWVIALICIVSLFLGTFLDGMQTLLLTVPIFLPVTILLGLDTLHITLLLVIASVVGSLTPPVGVLIYIMSTVSKLSIWAISKAIIPFLIVNIIVVFFVAYFPEIVLYLPNLLGK